MPSMDMMQEIASDEVLGLAYDWLCRRRRDYSANDDVWNVRWKWNEIMPLLQQQLLAGDYRFEPLRRIRCDKETIELWSALDALVLKAIAIVLTRRLTLCSCAGTWRSQGGGTPRRRKRRQQLVRISHGCDLHLYDGREHGFFNIWVDRKILAETMIRMDRFLSSLGYLEGDPALALTSRTQ